MSMTDPIADMLTRIRNALQAGHREVDIPASRLKEEMLTVMKREGFIEDVKLVEAQPRNMLQVTLRYSEAGRVPVIHGIKRVSRPSLRVYADGTTMRSVRSGLGITILTTSKGVMSSKEARRQNVGGEVLCEVW